MNHGTLPMVRSTTSRDMTASLVKPGWRARVTGVANALLRPRRLVAIFIILFLLDFLNILPLVFVLSRWLIIPRVCQQLEFDPLNQQHLSGAALSRLSIQQYSLWLKCLDASPSVFTDATTSRIIFDARDGLGNRMQAFSSALLLAVTTNSRLTVRWPPSHRAFRALFPPTLSVLLQHIDVFEDSWLEVITTAVPRISNILYNGWLIAPHVAAHDYTLYFDSKLLCGQPLDAGHIALWPTRTNWMLTNQYLASLIGQHPRLRAWWLATEQTWFATSMRVAFPLIQPTDHLHLANPIRPSLKPATVPINTLVVHLRFFIPLHLYKPADFRVIYNCVDRILKIKPRRYDYVYLMQESNPLFNSSRHMLTVLLQGHRANSTAGSIQLLPQLKLTDGPSNNILRSRSLGDDALAISLQELIYVSNAAAFIHTRFSTFGTLMQALSSATDSWVLTFKFVIPSVIPSSATKHHNCERVATSEPMYPMLALVYQQCNIPFQPVFGARERIEF